MHPHWISPCFQFVAIFVYINKDTGTNLKTDRPFLNQIFDIIHGGCKEICDEKISASMNNLSGSVHTAGRKSARTSVLQTAMTVVHREYGSVHNPRLLWCKEQDAARNFLRCQQLLVGNHSSCCRLQHLQTYFCCFFCQGKSAPSNFCLFFFSLCHPKSQLRGYSTNLSCCHAILEEFVTVKVSKNVCPCDTNTWKKRSTRIDYSNFVKGGDGALWFLWTSGEGWSSRRMSSFFWQVCLGQERSLNRFHSSKSCSARTARVWTSLQCWDKVSLLTACFISDLVSIHHKASPPTAQILCVWQNLSLSNKEMVPHQTTFAVASVVFPSSENVSG